MGHDRSARAQQVLMPLAANAPNSSQKAAREKVLRTRNAARIAPRAAHTLTWPTAGRSRCQAVLASRRATTGSWTGRRPCAMTDGGLTMLVLDSAGGREGAAARLNSR